MNLSQSVSEVMSKQPGGPLADTRAVELLEINTLAPQLALHHPIYVFCGELVESLKQPLCVSRSGALLIIVEKNKDNSLLLEQMRCVQTCNVAFGYLPW
jgi:hypothetical protein